MYEYIKGNLASLSHTTAVIDVGGVGYALSISLTSHAVLEGQQDVLLYVHLYYVQDQAPVMYGFATMAERELFRLLISVSGIGAGTARIMLSSHSPRELAAIISTGNVALLTSVKGIGAKTAEVVIIKLRDKVVRLGLDVDGEYADGGSPSPTNGAEALEALLVLGFSKVATEKVVRKLAAENPEMPTEELIRKALSQM